MIVHYCRLHNTAQKSSDNFPSCPPDNHHSSDVVSFASEWSNSRRWAWAGIDGYGEKDKELRIMTLQLALVASQSRLRAERLSVPQNHDIIAACKHSVQHEKSEW